MNLLKKVSVLKYILVLGFALRLIGFWWGYPLLLNTDEPTTLTTIFKFSDGLNPGRFDWPSLNFYFYGFFLAIYKVLLNLIDNVLGIQTNLDDTANYLIIGRIVASLVSTLSIFFMYKAAINFFDQKVAIAVALILAFNPLHVYESHFINPDILLTTIISAFVYQLSRIHISKSENYIQYAIAGALVGLATSVKYNGVLICFFLILMYIQRSKNLFDLISFYRFKHLVIAGIVSVFFFFVGSPFALIDFDLFFSTEPAKGALWQFDNVGSISIEDYPKQFIEVFMHLFKNVFGIGVWLTFLVLSIAFTFFNKRDNKTVLFMLPSLSLIIYMISFRRLPPHYFLYLLPFVLLPVSDYLKSITEFVNNIPTIIKKRKFRLNYFQILFLILIPSIYMSFRSALLFTTTDTRVELYHYLSNRVKSEGGGNFTNLQFVVMGEELDELDLGQVDIHHVNRIRRVDRSHLKNQSTPFFIIIGVRGLEENIMVEGDRDSPALKGDQKPILQNADLLFHQTNNGRNGPPIYFYYVKEIEKNSR